MFKNFTIDTDTALMYLARVIAFLTAIPIHESAHAWVSYKLGDPTARNLKRISLNPARHFDLMGALFMLIMGFGWAKPVPINTGYYANRKFGMAVSSLAGPVSNFIFAFFLMILYKLTCIVYYTKSSTSFFYALMLILYFMVIINLSLAVFNILPVPPLDGSRIFLLFLPERLYFGIMKYERYIMIIFFAVLSSGIFDGALRRMQTGLFNIVFDATMFIDILFNVNFSG